MLTKIKLLFMILFSFGTKNMTVIRKGKDENPFLDLDHSHIFGDKSLIELLKQAKDGGWSIESIERLKTMINEGSVKINDLETLVRDLQRLKDENERKISEIRKEWKGAEEIWVSEESKLKEEISQLKADLNSERTKTPEAPKGETHTHSEYLELEAHRDGLADALVSIHNTNTRFSKDNIEFMRKAVRNHAKEKTVGLKEK